MTRLRQRMLEDMQIRSLSPHAQASYLEHVARFARHFRQSSTGSALLSNGAEAGRSGMPPRAPVNAFRAHSYHSRVAGVTLLM